MGRPNALTLAASAAALVAAALVRGAVTRRRQRRDASAARAGAEDVRNSGPDLFKIVLTGGPCAGKTTALARLAGFLRKRGFRVYTVPEAATMAFTSGVAFADLDCDARVFAFQTAILSLQRGIEAGGGHSSPQSATHAILRL